MIAFEERFMNEGTLPRVIQVTAGCDASLESVVGWFCEHQGLLRDLRSQYGAVLVRGFRVLDSAERFAAILDVVAPELMDYIGGTSERSAVRGNVFGTNTLPGSYTVPLHQEMAYQDHRPDCLALFCQVPASEGGETMLADARLVTARIDEALRARSAPHLEVVRALPCVRREYRTRPWMDVFGTSDREQVEQIAREKDWKIAWNTDGSMSLRQRMTTFRTHPRSGAVVWANQLHLHMPGNIVRWARRDGRAQDVALFETMLRFAPQTFDHVLYRDGSPVTQEEAFQVWQAIDDSGVPVGMAQGDVLLVDNVLTLHGRKQFKGERKLLVGLIREPAES